MNYADQLRRRGIKVSERGARCAELLGEFFGGLHHWPSRDSGLEATKWDGFYVTVRLNGTLSTFDSADITRLVLLAHQHCIRVEVRPVMAVAEYRKEEEEESEGRLVPIEGSCLEVQERHLWGNVFCELELLLHPRDATKGGTMRRHPDLEELKNLVEQRQAGMPASNAVEVYRNLRHGKKATPLYSVRSKGRVINRAHEVLLKDVTFTVHEAGRQRVLAQKRKNVHAFVRGHVIGSLPERERDGIEVTYNPYKAAFFHHTSGREVVGAAYARLGSVSKLLNETEVQQASVMFVWEPMYGDRQVENKAAHP